MGSKGTQLPPGRRATSREQRPDISIYVLSGTSPQLDCTQCQPWLSGIIGGKIWFKANSICLFGYIPKCFVFFIVQIDMNSYSIPTSAKYNSTANFKLYLPQSQYFYQLSNNKKFLFDSKNISWFIWMTFVIKHLFNNIIYA